MNAAPKSDGFCELGGEEWGKEKGALDGKRPPKDPCLGASR